MDTSQGLSYLQSMEVQFSPEIQARLDRLANETGRAKDQFVQDAMPGYLDELEQTREMLDSRYDDIKSGRVQPIDGEEAFARLREKSEAQQPRMSGYILHSEAYTDIEGLWEFIAKDNLDAADRVREEIYETIQALVAFPHQGHPTSLPAPCDS